jgi:hypothetical protein
MRRQLVFFLINIDLAELKYKHNVNKLVNSFKSALCSNIAH